MGVPSYPILPNKCSGEHTEPATGDKRVASTNVGRIPVSVQLKSPTENEGVQQFLSHPSEHRWPLQRGHSSYNKMLDVPQD